MMFSTFKFCIFSGIAVFIVNIHASDAAPEGSPGSLIANDTAEHSEPKAEGEVVPYDEFLKRYNETNLPIGTIVRFEGSMRNRTRKDQRNPDSPLLPHHSADFVTTFQIGYPNRIIYETANFAVPWDVDPDKRNFNVKDVLVVGDGRTWTELLFGSSSTYKRRPFRAENEADINPVEKRSWYVSHFFSGSAFFTQNLDDGYVSSLRNPRCRKLTGDGTLNRKAFMPTTGIHNWC